MLDDVLISFRLWQKARFQGVILLLGFFIALTFTFISISSWHNISNNYPKGISNYLQTFSINGIRTSGERQGVSLKKVEELKKLAIIKDVTYFDFSELSLSIDKKQNETELVALISDSFLDVFSIDFELGALTNDFYNAKEVVLSYDYWKSKYQKNKKIINEKLYINNEPYRIIGVLDEKFTGLNKSKPKVWIANKHYTDFLHVSFGSDNSMPDSMIKKIKENIAFGQNRLFVNITTHEGIGQETLNNDLEKYVNNTSLKTETNIVQEDLHLEAFDGFNYQPKANKLIAIQMGALTIISSLLLLSVTISYIAAVFNQVLGRGKEFEIRISLGAVWWDIYKQLIKENILFLVSITLFSCIISEIIIKIFSFIPIFSITNGLFVSILITIALCLFVVGLVSVASLLPLLQFIKGTKNHTVSANRSFSKNKFFENIIITSQAAFMFVVVTVSLQVWASQYSESSNNRGFLNDQSSILSLEIRFNDKSDNLLGTKALHDLLEKKSTKQFGIKNIAFSDRAPQSREMLSVEANIPSNSQFSEISLLPISVSGSYFDVLGIKLLKGRVFLNTDEAVINRNFYEGDVFGLIGKEIILDTSNGKVKKIIVGIVEDVAHTGSMGNIPATIYYEIEKENIIATEYLLINSSASKIVNWEAFVTSVLPSDSVVKAEYHGLLKELISKQYSKEKLLVNILIILCVIVSAFVMMSAAAIQNSSFRNKRAIYAIHLSLGASRQTVFLKVFSFYLFLTSVGIFLVMPILPMIIQNISQYLNFVKNIDIFSLVASFICLVIMTLITNIPSFVTLFRLNLAELIKPE